MANTPTGLPDGKADATIDLEIENVYADGQKIVTRVVGALVQAPQKDSNEDAIAEWAWDQLFPFTGTGRHESDAWYEVFVTACDVSPLVGRKFEFG
jgi:hypothetical protein